MVWFIRKKLGFIVTSIWIVGILLLWILGDLKKPTSLNELGDFLAGAFAPIAFLWLVLGYKQQGKQLDQNSIAISQQAKALQQQAEVLKLQIDEMKESVKQQKELVEVQNKQMHSIHGGAEPSLILRDGKIELRINKQIVSCVLKVELENIGIGSARNICIFNMDGDYLTSMLASRDQSLDKFTLKPEEKIKINTFIGEDLILPNEGGLGLLKLIYAELSGDFPLGDSRQPTYNSLRPFDWVS